MRVAFVPRSVEIKPTFWRFVTIIFISSYHFSGEGLPDILGCISLSPLALDWSFPLCVGGDDENFSKCPKM